MSDRQDLAERVAAEAGSHGKLLGHIVGAKYPKFRGASRSALVALLTRHGFEAEAKPLEDSDYVRALSATVAESSRGILGSLTPRSGRLQLKLDPLPTESPDVKSWGVYWGERKDSGQRSTQFVCGARVYATPTGIYHDRPVDHAEHEVARRAAEMLAIEANRRIAECSLAEVSKAVGSICESGGGLPFISRGSYVLPIQAPRASAALDVLRALRSEHYDTDTRSGVRIGIVTLAAHDADALSDAVIDEAEERLVAMAAKVRDTLDSRKKVHGRTLDTARQECRDLLALVKAHQERLGAWGARLLKQATDLHTTWERQSTSHAMWESDVPEWARADEPPADPLPDPRRPEPVPEAEPAPASEPPPPAPAKPAPAAPPDDDDSFS